MFRTRLLQFFSLALLVVALFTVSIYGYSVSSHRVVDLEFDRKTHMVEMAAMLVRQNLVAAEVLGVSLAARPRVVDGIAQGDWAAALKAVERVPHYFPEVEQITFTDPKGVVRTELASGPDAVGQDLAAAEWYKGVSAAWQPYVSDVFVVPGDPRRHSIEVAVPVRAFGAGNEVIGILVLRVKLDSLVRLVQEMTLSFGEILYIVDRQGRVVYHPSFPREGDLVDFSTVPLVRKLLSGREGVEVNYNTVEKVRRLAAYKKVAGYGWGVVLTQPVRQAFAERDRANAQSLVIYGIVIFSGLFCVLMIVRLFIQQEADARGLRAREQQLRAINQQLTASEQQLKALNQQLRANEQQLKAVNQQLRANEQQVKAVNQQLLISKEDLERHRQELQEKVLSLEKINKTMTGRELRIIELKERIKALESKAFGES